MFRLIPTVLLLLSLFSAAYAQGIFQNLSAIQCDSLVRANASNPNFAILDVRTPGEYNPQHLVGAINRNYYDGDFEAQLDALDKNKIYLMHCRSGGRSGNTLPIMRKLGFREVYNMLGGIIAWNRANLPTTADFAPLAMLVTDSIVSDTTIIIGQTDTIPVTITNRANSQLNISSYSLPHPEFTTSLDTSLSLKGAQDYTLDVIYRPVDVGRDTAILTLNTNGGTLVVTFYRSGEKPASAGFIRPNHWTLSPNPVRDYIRISGLDASNHAFEILDINGRKVLQLPISNGQTEFDLSPLHPGVYFLKTAKGVQRFLRY